ncbi:MAG: hypothetical protein GXY83_09410 [Rhodopirellula sp.]|nr:hypothetical protein [Rhodopirellula sp.]
MPSPQHGEELPHRIRIGANEDVDVVIGPAQAAADRKMQYAAEMLRSGLNRHGRVVPPAAPSPSAVRIHLWDYSRDPKPLVPLNSLDEDTLTGAAHYRQGYVLNSPDASTVWIVGASPQGAIWGAASLLQLQGSDEQGVYVEGAYLRDYPHFEFRAASDWLLNIEINGWDLDRGKGVDDFARLVEARIDRALRFKINMALIDGFGFGISQRPAYYQDLMLRLNRYARARGFSLCFGGYGASYGMAYEPVVMYEKGTAFKGQVFLNRRTYPDGSIYRCMGFPKARHGHEPAELGSCRSNDELNRLKADELRAFVAAVEPGALYIHHEDFGGFQGTQNAWRQQRCEQCRRRWPNDALQVRDGGAGGLAHGYSALIEAVNSVKKPEAGYDAARDCQIILVSPVYVPDGPRSEDWAAAVELWRNIALEIPKATNVQACFREVYPLPHGGERFTEKFAAAMREAGSPLRVFMFFAGGADRFYTDYPLTGTAALDALFLGSRGIYNTSGDFYQEPMELINAEFSWNAQAKGFRVPRDHAESQQLVRSYMLEENQPADIFGPGELYDVACERLYGRRAARLMAKYYRLSAMLPETPVASASTGRPMTYLPLTWDRAYAAPSHWRRLVQDSMTWGASIDDEVYVAAMQRMGIERGELHRRMSRRWGVMSGLNRDALGLLDSAIQAGPQPESLEDLRFLKTLLTVYQPMFDALAAFHGAWHARLSGRAPDRQGVDAALRLASQARQRAEREFPRPIDPVGGEIGALLRLSEQLQRSIEARQKEW